MIRSAWIGRREGQSCGREGGSGRVDAKGFRAGLGPERSGEGRKACLGLRQNEANGDGKGECEDEVYCCC